MENYEEVSMTGAEKVDYEGKNTLVEQYSI